MKYIKKPVTIEAVQWNGLNLNEIKEFVGESLIYTINDAAWKVNEAPPIVDMQIKTLEGNMLVSVGDYIIKGIQGEFYPCKPDIFEQTYTQLDESTSSTNNPCPHCNPPYEHFGKYYIKTGYPNDPGLHVLRRTDAIGGVMINYCPMCSRKLEE